MPDFKRGAEAIAKAQEKSKSGGEFRPFTPEFFWKADDERFLLFLNPVNGETGFVTIDELISFIPIKRKKADGDTFTTYERVIARTDPVIGEKTDPMVTEWDGQPKTQAIAVAVELEPTYKEDERTGRKRPSGFAVKTREFERRVRDDDGE